MGFEKRDPIPPGVYWIDTFNEYKGVPRFMAWLKKNRDNVRVLKKERHYPSSGVAMREKARWWFLFQVRKPVPRWPVSAKLGLPTKAPKGKRTEESDTVQKPDPWDISFPEYKTGFGSGLGLALLLWLATR